MFLPNSVMFIHLCNRFLVFQEQIRENFGHEYNMRPGAYSGKYGIHVCSLPIVSTYQYIHNQQSFMLYFQITKNLGRILSLVLKNLAEDFSKTSTLRLLALRELLFTLYLYSCLRPSVSGKVTSEQLKFKELTLQQNICVT